MNQERLEARAMNPEAVPSAAETRVPSIAERRKKERPFFDQSKMPPPTNQYVCWTDVMGSQSIMLRALGIASNFVMKLHVAALRASESCPVELYPVIDGVYVCSQTQSAILEFLRMIYSGLAVLFILEPKPYFRFQIRSGLAYGPVARGIDALGCADELGRHPDHTNKILLGPPLAQAYQIERQAAPFGIALHESTRTFAPPKEEVMFGTYWKWWKLHPRAGDEVLASELLSSLKAHYEWCLQHTVALSYEKADIERHKLLANEYFSD